MADRQDLAAIAERPLEGLEVASRKRGRAVVAHGSRIDREEIVHIVVDRGGEIALQRLANHGALLARDLFEVLLLGTWDRRLEGGVEIVAHDPTLSELHLRAAAHIPQFDVVHAGLTSHTLCLL
jgi:hypothetical protein